MRAGSDAKRQARDALDAARRNAATKGGDSGEGKDGALRERGMDALVEVPGELTSQSRHSLRLSGSPRHGKLLIPLERRDVRVVKGARLENEFRRRSLSDAESPLRVIDSNDFPSQSASWCELVNFRCLWLLSRRPYTVSTQF